MMRDERLFVGVDLGTSGCRIVAIGANGEMAASAARALPPISEDGPRREQEPQVWWDTFQDTLTDLHRCVDRQRVAAVAVDGTSGTVVFAAKNGEPLQPAWLYHDARAVEAARDIAATAPQNTGAIGPTASLAKVLHAHRHGGLPPGTRWILHAADWMSGRLLGRFGNGDEHNALKLGFDPVHRQWPDWLERFDLPLDRLPRIHRSGSVLGSVPPAVTRKIGWPAGTFVVAGTTDSTAATLAANLRKPGQALTSLGSTLVVKVLSPEPAFDSASGVYSHRLDAGWLVGGASNSGGAVLQRFFSDAEIERLSKKIDPASASGLDYYPLPAIGERFPVCDPVMEPRLTPRPDDPARFLHGLLEGIARIERMAYERLHALGAPAPVSVATSGGGAPNPTWTAMRQHLLGVPVYPAQHQEAAYGAALLARNAVMTQPSR